MFSTLHGVLIHINDGVMNFKNSVRSSVTEGSTQTNTGSLLDQIRRECEFMAQDVVRTFGDENAPKSPNKYCKTLRRTVKEISVKHDLVFKGIVNKLQPDAENALNTFVVVADELFDEGPVNWGRVVALYAFAAHLAKYVSSNIDRNDTQLIEEQQDGDSSQPKIIKEKIAEFVGKYVGNKLGQWILNNGGWNAFLEYFPDQPNFEATIWKAGLVTALGLGALALAVKR